MAGHSQFKNIMHRKGAQDVRRARLFSKLGREIFVAAKSGQPDPDMNPRLRTAIAKARAESMPNDRIKASIARALPGQDSTQYEEVRYEGYGPGGVAVLVEALTDNRNRTAGEVRAAFTKKGGNLGETNSVSFMFDRIGLVTYAASVAGDDAMFEAARDAGAQNVERVGNTHEIATAPDALAGVRDALEQKFGAPQSASLVWRPNVLAAVADADLAKDIMGLIDILEDNDDVQAVFVNADIGDDIAQKLAAS